MTTDYSLLDRLRKDPSGRGQALREVSPHFAEIEQAVAQGFSLRRCYDALYADERITVTYESFRRTVQRLRKDAKDETAEAAPSSSERTTARPEAPARTDTRASGLRRAQWPPKRSPQE
ncbi:MAG: TraK family protein [Chloroflexota bacterium]|nr:TraK family protein [Chloroflexota bacterium]